MKIREGIQDLGSDLRMAAELHQRHSDHIDEKMLEIARRSGGALLGKWFELLTPEEIALRPDSVNHSMTLLPPNAKSTNELEARLTLAKMFKGENGDEITDQFRAVIEKEDIFGRIDAGQTIFGLDNHFLLADKGVTEGEVDTVALEQGFDQFPNYVTVLLGRVLGYFKLAEPMVAALEAMGTTIDDPNIMDGILRKGASVLKTFPTSGGEAVDETDGQHVEEMRVFRRYCNLLTRREVQAKVESSTGGIIILAGGGAVEHPNRDTKTIAMHPFGNGNRAMLAEACAAGAYILPIFTDYDPDSRSLVDFGDLVQITDPDEIHKVGRTIAALGNRARALAHQDHPEVERFDHQITYAETH